jgi:hypothetical protein
VRVGGDGVHGDAGAAQLVGELGRSLFAAGDEGDGEPLADGFAEYAGRLYDYHRQHPALARLLQWEALAFESEVPEESSRREYYAIKTAAITKAQDAARSSTRSPLTSCTSCCCHWPHTGPCSRRWRG